ncbi:MAG TPA: signal peptidase II [Thermoleophilaceae bacterium]
MASWVLAGAGAVVLLDQVTKSLAVRFLASAGVGGARRSGVFRLAANGGSWLGRAPSLPAQLGLWSMTLACTVLVLATGAGSPSHGLAGAGLVVALGGATSNLLDRAGRGAVIDFIALGWWPAFNLADVAIVAGVAVAVGSVV